MHIALRLFILAQFFFTSAHAQKRDLRLQKEVESLVKGFNGDVGIFIQSLQTGRTVEIGADTIFPSASIVKVPILLGIMHRIHKGELDYHMPLFWPDTLKYDPGEDIIPYLKPQTKIELSKVMMLMMTISDNNASLWLQDLAGKGQSINRLMDSLGYVHTRVNSRTPGRESYRSVFGWGQTTPREMARIFADVVDHRVFSDAACERMLRIMGRQYWDEEALSSLPADVFVASKNGAVNASRSEVLFVNGKHPYILSIFTKNNTDTTWGASNEAWELTRKISARVWAHFN
jgi:beta-lactamase class A